MRRSGEDRDQDRDLGRGVRGDHPDDAGRVVVDRLGALRGPGESYRDVILRIAAQK
jgi:hypothetical protein